MKRPLIAVLRLKAEEEKDEASDFSKNAKGGVLSGKSSRKKKRSGQPGYGRVSGADGRIFFLRTGQPAILLFVR
jgi:hypothetical protein